MTWSIQQVARVSGVTSRALRHYDEIGLLRPARLGANGYRYYEREQLLRLQQILVLRELGMDLASIGAVVGEHRDPADALDHHHHRLLGERRRLDDLAATVAATIRHLREGSEMPVEDLFGPMTPERAGYLSGLPKKRTATGVLFCDEQQRVLLVAPTYKPYWQLPGGVANADESPLSAGIRAVDRELGLRIEPGRLLVIDWVAPRSAAIEGLLFVFDGPALSPAQVEAIALPPEELRAWEWCARKDLDERLPAHMLRRIKAALQAKSDGATRYLENGAADIAR